MARKARVEFEGAVYHVMDREKDVYQAAKLDTTRLPRRSVLPRLETKFRNGS
jgi:hypothetical protein